MITDLEDKLNEREQAIFKEYKIPPKTIKIWWGGHFVKLTNGKIAVTKIQIKPYGEDSQEYNFERDSAYKANYPEGRWTREQLSKQIKDSLENIVAGLVVEKGGQTSIDMTRCEKNRPLEELKKSL